MVTEYHTTECQQSHHITLLSVNSHTKECECSHHITLLSMNGHTTSHHRANSTDLNLQTTIWPKVKSQHSIQPAYQGQFQTFSCVVQCEDVCPSHSLAIRASSKQPTIWPCVKCHTTTHFQTTRTHFQFSNSHLTWCEVSHHSTLSNYQV